MKFDFNGYFSKFVSATNWRYKCLTWALSSLFPTQSNSDEASKYLLASKWSLAASISSNSFLVKFAICTEWLNSFNCLETSVASRPASARFGLKFMFSKKATKIDEIFPVDLTLLVMPYPFTGPKMFCASPNFLSQPKNLTAFSASSKTFVLAQKPILLNANHLFVWHKLFVTATICR